MRIFMYAEVADLQEKAIKALKSLKNIKQEIAYETITTLPHIQIKGASTLDLSVAVHMHQSVNRPTHHGSFCFTCLANCNQLKVPTDGSAKCYLM